MKYSHLAGVFVALWVFHTSTSLFAQLPVLSPAGKIVEAYDPTRNVSAQFVAGVSMDASNQPIDGARPKVFLPSGLSGKICFDVNSQNGSYSGHAEYAIANMASGIYSLEFVSQHREFNAFHIDTVAALAELKPDCSKPSEGQRKILPVFWSSSTPNFPIHLLLQTDTNTGLVFSTASEPSITCKRTHSQSYVIFNSQCEVPSGYGSSGVIAALIDTDNTFVQRIPLSFMIR